mgnify:CR=1 FL=1
MPWYNFLMPSTSAVAEKAQTYSPVDKKYDDYIITGAEIKADIEDIKKDIINKNTPKDTESSKKSP